MSVLIVGAGITGALIGYFLRTLNSNIVIDLWEAEQVPGGRMQISEYDTDFFADIGLQYISTDNLHSSDYSEIYNTLINNRLLQPLTCKILNSNKYYSNSDYFVAPKGARSIVEFFINEAKFNTIRYGYKVKEISIDPNSSIRLTTEQNQSDSYRTVILTVPVPQILNEIKGNYKDFVANDNELYNSLKHVKYGSKYALVSFFDKSLESDWGAQFIKNDIFRYVAIDNIKRNQFNTKSAIIFHTEDNFALDHIDKTVENVKVLLKEHALKLFPEWSDSVETKCHKWKYATVRSAANFNKSFITLLVNPLFIMAGDSFTGSKFDNNILSARETVSFITKILKI